MYRYIIFFRRILQGERKGRRHVRSLHFEKMQMECAQEAESRHCNIKKLPSVHFQLEIFLHKRLAHSYAALLVPRSPLVFAVGNCLDTRYAQKYPGCQRSTRCPSRRPAEGWQNERTARSERRERSVGRE